jgi:hypothetical protein
VNSDLIEAYELAKRYLAGDIVIKPSTPKILEIEPKLEPKKKSPKKYQIKQGEYKVKGQSFKAGDVLIVDTSLGK